jgi:hypothetical protein
MQFPIVHTRQFMHHVPSVDGCDWEFSFTVTITDNDTQRVVVDWSEPSIGSGSFTIKASGITPTVMLQVYRFTEKTAFSHAESWNADDAG